MESLDDLEVVASFSSERSYAAHNLADLLEGAGFEVWAVDGHRGSVDVLVRPSELEEASEQTERLRMSHGPAFSEAAPVPTHMGKQRNAALFTLWGWLGTAIWLITFAILGQTGSAALTATAVLALAAGGVVVYRRRAV